MISEIGHTDESLEQRFELRVFGIDGQHVVTFKESTFKNAQVVEHVQDIPYFDGLLSADASNAQQLVEAATYVQVGRVIEIWAAGREQPLILLIRATVDFLNIRSGQEVEGGGAEIKLMARSVVSPCMDSGVRSSGSGSLIDLVKMILAPHRIGSSVDTIQTEKIDYYADSESGYAALRLLGLTFKAVISTTRDGQIDFADVPRALEKFQKNPVRTVTQDDMLGMQLQQGQPFRKRGEK
jgi:hypothetical protein